MKKQTRMQSLLALALSAVLCVGSAAPAAAAGSSAVSQISSAAATVSSAAQDNTNYELKKQFLRLAVPEGFVPLTLQDTPDDDTLQKLHIESWSETVKEMKEQSRLITLYAPDGSYTLNINGKQSKESQEYFDISLMRDAQIQELMKGLSTTQEQGQNKITGKASKYKTPGGQLFIKVELNGLMQGRKIQEQAYFTIMNGLGFTMGTYNDGGTLTAAQEKGLAALVDSIRFTKRLPKPAASNDAGSSLLLSIFLPILVIALLIVCILVVGRLRKKHEKERANVVLARLTEYRERQLAAEAQAKEQHLPLQEPESLLENETKCTTKNLKRFSWMDLLLNRKATWIPMLIAGVAFIVVGAALLNGFTQWLCIILGALCLLRPLFIPSRVFKTEDSMYRKIKSRRVHYQFREEDFRVTGPGAGVYPYVQVVHARETKDFFYLYLGEQHIYLVKKSGFTKGDAGTLRRLLKEAGAGQDLR